MVGGKEAAKLEKIDLDRLNKAASQKSVEKLPLSEKRPEAAPVKAEQVKEVKKPLEKGGAIQPSAIVSPTGSFQQRAAQIDDILADGLNDVFLKMTTSQQAEFKKKGEETVTKINKLLNQARIKVNKIISLIRKWLQLIPGINIFFLEQEAKLKADKIVSLKDK